MAIPQVIHVYDRNGALLAIGDKVRFLDMVGTVDVECGAMGIAFDDPIDWAAVDMAVKEHSGGHGQLLACQNDNFISFWEIAWNLDAEDDVIPCVELLGDIA